MTPGPPLDARALDSQPQETGGLAFGGSPQSHPNERPLMHAEMLKEIGNMETGKSVWPECLKH